MSSFTFSSSSSSSKRKRDILMEGETSQLADDKFISWLSSPNPRYNYGDKFSAFYTASLNSRLQDVIQILKQSKCPLLVGIWGMPGIGKTAIARVIYDRIGPYFEYTCFFEDVRGLVKFENEPLVSLQKKFHFAIDKATEINISTIESGKVILKETLQDKRVLLVLDDVNKLEQLNALCGSFDWFGEGSKIIITTRDRKLLKEHGVDHIYRLKELDQSESLELFNSKAFRQATSRKGFGKLSRQVVTFSGGLPLALLVLGRHLHSKKVDFWESELHKLTEIPNIEVRSILEDSINDLSDEEQQIFLDIAYLFIGRNQEDVLQILNRSTPSAALQISLLENKCFLTIDENNNLQVHVQLQAMAKYIIERKSIDKTIQPKLYDVFLSFRGEDSRAKFMSHLYSSLQNAGIYAFRDDDEIQRGDQIQMSLLRAIGQSRIYIVVLSTNYANSRWCMLELVMIMEIGRVSGVVVLPVFYEVDPSEVRHQEGQFGKAFEHLISRISVDESTKRSWRRVLVDIGGIAGFVLIDSRNESADIKNIVENVTCLLDRTELFVAEHPVGLESRVEAATKLLNIQKSEDVLILGIWGMGGMGKTTLAKAIYNQIGSKFEGRSFLLNIREVWETDTSQVSLQQRMLSDVYKTLTFKIRDVESGKSILKERLAQTRVLVVLDDVNELEQLKALCGSRDWFGPGSRIIITTRDINLLMLSEVDQVYPIEEMDDSESLKLFSLHAFKQPSPTEDFATHSNDVIAYSGRLPLALEVLGSYLSNCEITEWQKVLEKLKCIPHDQVQKKLKVSFDGLQDFTEKQIFLDIACFFIGMDKRDVVQILDECGFFADIGIKVLVERALVTVDNMNKLRMHDMLRDMGRQIICEEYPTDPEKRSRLWRHEEVYDILAKRKGTQAVKGLALEFPKKDCLETKAFKKMNKLRLLRLAGVKLEGDFKYLSGDLRWLYWHGFPLTYIPAEFQQGSLVAIELKYSKLQKIWNKSQMLENLKILNLSHSLDLTETPNFSYLPNLEKLVLKDCPSLSTVSHSIGSLHKLLLINLTDCTGLQTLPRSIYKLKSLETLILSGCSKIDKLEEDLEHMESLITLIADKTAITKVPFSIVRLKSIEYISLSGFEGFSRDVFPSLIRSWMSPSNNLVQSLVSMSSLGTSKDLQKLRILCAECDSDLQLTQYIGRFSDVLKATNRQNLEASASSTASQISDMHASPLIGDRLGHVHTLGSKNHLKSLLIQMGTKCQIYNVAEESVFQTADETWDLFLLSCDHKSDWLTFSCKGCSIIFDVPTMKGRNLKSMMLYIVYSSCLENITSEGCQGMLIINYTKTTIHAYKRDTLTSFEDEDWQSITSNLEPGNKVGVTVVFGEGVIVEKTTISLFYDEPVDKETESCDAVDEEDVIVPGNDNNNVSVFGGDNEAINCLGEETVNYVQVCISSSKNSLTSLLIQMGMSCDITNILRENILQHIESGLLPGDNYPDWLTFNSNSSSVTFEIPQVYGRSLKTIMCIAYSSSPNNTITDGFDVLLVINYTKNSIQVYKRDELLDSSDEEEWQRVIANIEPGNKIEVVVVFTNEFTVKKTTIYLVYDEPIQERTNHCHEPDENTQIDKLEEDIQQTKSLTTLVVDSTAITKTQMYDVFLSFRGEDCCPKFISHLDSSLQNAGIVVFKDNHGIHRGDQILVSLLQAISQSRICIVVLSTNYANSTWCMVELERIVEISRIKGGLVVVPVFYEVDPWDVRNQTGMFGEEFDSLISTKKVDEKTKRIWKAALNEVGGRAGGVVIKNSRNESEAIKKIVELVTLFLDKTELFVADHPVGLKSRVQDVIQLLNSQKSKEPLLLGIWGMGGIGKTTIAKAVYNEIHHDFEAKSFLLNVRESWKLDSDKVALQQQLLSDIYKIKKIKIDTVKSGKMILQERLCEKKIFIVIDDVDNLDQMNALCGNRKWFGEGSRIIITTRNEDLLGRLEVDHVYRMKEMDDSESLELFNWHAFKQPIPRAGFTNLSRDVVKYSGGLPLALQVIGSFLLTRRREAEWKSVLEKLNLIPNVEVTEKLKISFDCLKDDVKDIFLDIAFFFIGMDREDVTEILKDCGNFPEIGISVLIQQSLVTVDRKNKIEMHDLLRSMGREIVRKKSIEGGKEPSRLWRYEDVLELSKDTSTLDVKGLTFKMSRMDSTTYLETKAFEKMDKLRFLQLSGVQLVGDYKYLSKELKWLSWHGFPLKFIPADFYQDNLVAVELKYSNLERVWRESQLLVKLKILNLSHSHNLRHTPDFSNLPNLEKLILKDCPSLSSVSSNIGQLKKILLINLKDCRGLRKLPRSIYKLDSLKTLILSGCTKIDKLEEDIEQMKSLTTLVADKTAITRVPFAVVRLKSIAYISLCDFEGFTRTVFPSIIKSWLSPTNKILSLVQTFAGTLCLDITDEQNNNFYCLSSIFEHLQDLHCLWLKCDSEAQLNQTVASILYSFNTQNCEGFSIIGTSASIQSRIQASISSSKNSLTSFLIQMGVSCNVANILRENILQKMPRVGTGLLPGDNYPDWLTFNSSGSSVTFEAPQVVGRSLKTIMCIAYSLAPDKNIIEGFKVVLVINCTKNIIQVYKIGALLASFDDDEWQRVISNIEPGNEIKVVVVFTNEFIVKETTIYLVYDEPIEEKTNHRHEADENGVVSSNVLNIFGRHFCAIPSLARTVLTSRPFWFCLAGIMVWSSRRHSEKRGRDNPILREVASTSSQVFNSPESLDKNPLVDLQEVKRIG